MKLKATDALCVTIFVLALLGTILLYQASRRSATEVQDFSIHEIPSPPPGATLPWPSPRNQGV